MRFMGLRIGIIVAALLGAAAAAQEPEPPRGNLDEGRINSDPLKGLIINRTVTVMGWDFYSNFTQVWQALYPDSQDTMTIIERPTAQFGSDEGRCDDFHETDDMGDNQRANDAADTAYNDDGNSNDQR